MSNTLSLVQVRSQIILAIAQANSFKKAGKLDEGWAILIDALKSAGDALEDPEQAAIAELTSMIADTQSEREGREISEADVYLRLLEWAGIADAMLNMEEVEE